MMNISMFKYTGNDLNIMGAPIVEYMHYLIWLSWSCVSVISCFMLKDFSVSPVCPISPTCALLSSPLHCDRLRSVCVPLFQCQFVFVCKRSSHFPNVFPSAFWILAWVSWTLSFVSWYLDFVSSLLALFATIGLPSLVVTVASPFCNLLYIYFGYKPINLHQSCLRVYITVQYLIFLATLLWHVWHLGQFIQH